jgi:hypothetical protein
MVGAVGEAEVLAVHFAPVPREVLRAAPQLRAVCVARVGLENVDVAAATARGVAVVPVFGRNATAVAELAVGLMLAEARDITRADASVKAGEWRKDFGGPGREIGGSTVGLIGLGHVGRAFAERMRGFGARLIAYAPYEPDDVLARYGIVRAGDLDTVFRESDVVQLFARQAIVSDFAWDLRTHLAHHGLDALIDTCVISYEQGREKPDPQLFLKACADLGAAPEPPSWSATTRSATAARPPAVYAPTSCRRNTVPVSAAWRTVCGS